MLLRKSIVLEAGLFDQSLRSCEDWDLWLRLLPEIEIVGSPKILVRYRIHGSSLSTNVEGMHQAAQAVIQKHFGEDDSQYDLWPVEKRRAYGGSILVPGLDIPDPNEKLGSRRAICI